MTAPRIYKVRTFKSWHEVSLYTGRKVLLCAGKFASLTEAKARCIELNARLEREAKK